MLTALARPELSIRGNLWPVLAKFCGWVRRFHTTSPTLLAIGWGIIATWWVGLILGILAAPAARLGSWPKFNAIVDSYLTDVVGTEREQKQRRLNLLENACAVKDQEIRKTRQELKSLAQLNGTSTDPETISQKQKLLLDDYTVYHQELAKTRFEVADLESRLAEQHALLANAGAIAADDPEVDALVQKDPVAHEIALQLELKKKQTPAEMGEIKVLEDQLGKRREQLVAVVRKRKQASVQAEIRRLTSLLNVKRQQCDVLAKQVDKVKEEVANRSTSTVDVDMVRSNLKLLEAVYAEINSARERLKVELDAVPRITLAERAEEPEN
jgi:hypothetical protein